MVKGNACHVTGVGQRKIRGQALSTEQTDTQITRRVSGGLEKIKALENESLENFKRNIWMVFPLTIDSFSMIG